MCSGRWPGVASAVIRTSPTSTVVAVGERLVAYSTLDLVGVDTWIVAPVASTSRPWPETWSAWLWVSRTWRIAKPFSSASSR